MAERAESAITASPGKVVSEPITAASCTVDYLYPRQEGIMTISGSDKILTACGVPQGSLLGLLSILLKHFSLIFRYTFHCSLYICIIFLKLIILFSLHLQREKSMN